MFRYKLLCDLGYCIGESSRKLGIYRFWSEIALGPPRPGDEFYDGDGDGDGDDRAYVRQGFTATMAASRGGHSGLVKELALLGAKVHALEGNREDALIIASEEGHVAVCSVLLGHGAVMTTRDTDGCTALHWAALRGNLQVGFLLCSKGADLMAVDKSGETPMLIYGSFAFPRLTEVFCASGFTTGTNCSHIFFACFQR